MPKSFSSDPLPSRGFWWSTIYRILFIVAALLFLITSYFIIRTYQVINSHLESQKWALPSTVYAQAPSLYEGMTLSRAWLIDYLVRRLEYSKASSTNLNAGEYRVFEESIEFQRSPVFPGETVRAVFSGNQIQKLITVRDGLEITSYELEPVALSNLFGSEWEKRTLVELNDVPAYLIDAFLSIEDRRFYDHIGVDPRSIVRALYNNLIKRESLQGASTITQQLAKNFYLTPERSMRRKMSEALMALIMEKRISKDRILELYLNEIYLGQRGAMSINGVGAASRLFFRKDVRNITLPEATLLAGMIRAPSTYNPYRHPEAAKNRRDTVLLIMKDTGKINAAQFEKAVATPIKVYSFDSRVNLAPYFGNLVKDQLLHKYGKDEVYKQNLRVFTTLDLQMQQAAEEALAAGLRQIDRIRYPRLKKRAQGALIAIEPRTGYIRAFVGGRSFRLSQFDRVRQAFRQPGSSFKPMVFSAALELNFKGIRLFNPATLVSDEPATFRFHNVVWQPRNYDSRYYGIVPLRDALAKSMNVATAKIAENVGLQTVVSLAKEFGLENLKPYPSLALGSFEVTPWQMAEAYTVFANGGIKTDLQAIFKVTDAKGATIERGKVEGRRIIHAETAYLITDMLKSAMRYGTAASVSRLGFNGIAAGKTGTTDDFRDAWFIGYTPDLICLVWTGYDDNSPIHMNGAQAALPIWVKFMKNALQAAPRRDFERPEGVVEKEIDPTTGKLAGDACWERTTELFIQGSEPVTQCTEYDHYAPEYLEFSTDYSKINQIEVQPADSEGDTFGDRFRELFGYNPDEEPSVSDEYRDQLQSETDSEDENPYLDGDDQYIYMAPETSEEDNVYSNEDIPSSESVEPTVEPDPPPVDLENAPVAPEEEDELVEPQTQTDEVPQ